MKVYVQTAIADITPDASSNLTTQEAAFLAIARHGEQGTYEFDMAEEYRERKAKHDPDPTHRERVRVTVEWPDLPAEVAREAEQY